MTWVEVKDSERDISKWLTEQSVMNEIKQVFYTTLKLSKTYAHYENSVLIEMQPKKSASLVKWYEFSNLVDDVAEKLNLLSEKGEILRVFHSEKDGFAAYLVEAQAKDEAVPLPEAYQLYC
jgi:hypothetical protein